MFLRGKPELCKHIKRTRIKKPGTRSKSKQGDEPAIDSKSTKTQIIDGKNQQLDTTFHCAISTIVSPSSTSYQDLPRYSHELAAKQSIALRSSLEQARRQKSSTSIIADPIVQMAAMLNSKVRLGPGTRSKSKQGDEPAIDSKSTKTQIIDGKNQQLDTTFHCAISTIVSPSSTSYQDLPRYSHELAAKQSIALRSSLEQARRQKSSTSIIADPIVQMAAMLNSKVRLGPGTRSKSKQGDEPAIDSKSTKTQIIDGKNQQLDTTFHCAISTIVSPSSTSYQDLPRYSHELAAKQSIALRSSLEQARRQKSSTSIIADPIVQMAAMLNSKVRLGSPPPNTAPCRGPILVPLDRKSSTPSLAPHTQLSSTSMSNGQFELLLQNRQNPTTNAFSTSATRRMPHIISPPEMHSRPKLDQSQFHFRN